MISNHNRNNSSFRIIEPKQQSPPKFQHAQQTPVNMIQQQIPILSVNNNSNSHQSLNSANMYKNVNNHNGGFNNQMFLSTSRSNHNIVPINVGHTNSVHYQKNSSRVRNLSETDSSYIPGKY